MSARDGSVVYLPHRNVWVGYWGGKIIATRNTEAAMRAYMTKKFSGIGALLAASRIAKTRKVSKFDTIRATLTLQTAEICEKARQVFGARLANWATPKVEFFNRGATAGKAWRLENKVAFNEAIAEHNGLDEFHNTVIHEVAHKVVHTLYPNAKAHGRALPQL